MEQSGVENVIGLAYVVWSLVMLAIGFVVGYLTGLLVRRWGDVEHERVHTRT